MAEGGITGKGFVKGKSGNPNGRKAIPQNVRLAFQAHTMEAKDTLVEIMRDKKAKSGDRVRASEIILNRAWGTPEQSVSVAGAVSTVSVDTSKLDEKAQEAILNAVVGIYGSDCEEPQDDE